MTCFRPLGLDEMFCVLEVPLSLPEDYGEVLTLSKSVFGQMNPLTFLILLSSYYTELSCSRVKRRLWIVVCTHPYQHT